MADRSHEREAERSRASRAWRGLLRPVAADRSSTGVQTHTASAATGSRDMQALSGARACCWLCGRRHRQPQSTLTHNSIRSALCSAALCGHQPPRRRRRQPPLGGGAVRRPDPWPAGSCGRGPARAAAGCGRRAGWRSTAAGPGGAGGGVRIQDRRQRHAVLVRGTNGTASSIVLACALPGSMYASRSCAPSSPPTTPAPLPHPNQSLPQRPC